MNTFFKVYTSTWVAACLTALILYIKDRKDFAFSAKSYQALLFKPWKVITFIISAGVLTAIAPYTGDITWDYYDTSIMSLLTYLTAPWAVGIVYRFRIGKASFRQLFVAFCCWMLSASWSYDIYMYFREGFYPDTWWPNIILSSMLYLCAGLFWSLDWKEGKGVFFSFTEDEWPAISKGRVFPRIFIASLPFALVVIVLCALVIYGMHTQRLPFQNI